MSLEWVVRNRRGFTLIELVIVVTILAILASVAIPVLQNVAGNARNSAAKGAVGAIRTALTTYRVSESASNRAAAWPSVGQVRDMLDDATAPKVMQNGELPDNPWALVDANATKRANADDINDMNIAKGTLCDSGGLFGWCYNSLNGLFWANTANNGSLGGTTENNF